LLIKCIEFFPIKVDTISNKIDIAKLFGSLYNSLNKLVLFQNK